MMYPANGEPGKRTPRDRILTRWASLKSERATWVEHWQEITNYLLPRNGRYFVQDRNKGTKRHNNIYDNTGTRSLRVMAAGMMAGATSPARPWFRLTTADPDLNKYHSVRVWLDDVAKRMMRVFQRSNTYRALHQIYEEIGAFGTACNLVLPDMDRLIHHYPITTGEYALAADYQGKVCTMYREFDKTVAEVVKEFGYENCCHATKNMYNNGSLDQYVTLIHAIEPREDRDPKKRDSLNMPWRSCYFELGSDNSHYLRESGFREFPVLAPRWAVAGGDVYGHSPGMESLGDIKQLQHEQLRKAQAIDYQTKPPLQVPSNMKSREVETLPGGITYVDSQSQQAGIRPAFEVNLRLDYLLQDIQDVRSRIESSFYADLFLMLANSNPASRMTATEVAERHEEKLLMLGPVMERLHNELLEPLIDSTFLRMLEANALPTPPREMQGADISVEFVSMLAQAQRAIGTNSLDRFVGSLGSIAQMKPDVLDRFDADEWVDAYSDMLGVDPNIIVSTNQAAVIREARDKAMAAKEQAAMGQQQATAARDLSLAKTGPQDANALTDVMNMFSGYNAPSPSQV